MNSEEDLSGKTPKTTGRSPEDICVLLLDSDPTCLTIISKMLHKSGYRVVTAERALDALHILREKDGEIDLIMTETHLSDMDKYELLETITRISNIPIVVMGADEQANSALGCLFKGAKHYLLKPFLMGELKHLWQTAIRSRRDVPSQIDTGRPKQNESGNDTQPPFHAEEHTKDKKRKEPAETEEHKEDNDDTCELRNQKKPKLIGADELQNGSLQGALGLGTEDEIYQDKKRKKRAETEKHKDYDDYELGNQKKPELIGADELQNRSLQGALGLGTEDEINQDKKRRKRAETEKHKDYDDYELGNQKMPKFSCADQLQNMSLEANQGLGTDDYNKEKEWPETETYEDGDNSELGIKKQQKLVFAEELENVSSRNVGDLGPDGAYPDENIQHVNVTELTKADVLPREQEQGMLVTTMCQMVSNEGVPENLETTMQFFGPVAPLSPVESSSNDHMRTQKHEPLPRRGTNLVENPQQNVKDNPAVEEPVNGEENVSGISELVFGNIMELPELLYDDLFQEHEQQELLPQEEQGSSSDVHEKSAEELLDEFFSDAPW